MRRVLASAAILVACTNLAVAQAPAIRGVVHSGVQRGTTASILLDSSGGPDSKILLSGTGLKVESVSSPSSGKLSVRVVASPDALLGPRELRVSSPLGVSNPATIWVDPFPEVQIPDSSREDPPAVNLESGPAVYSGRLLTPKSRVSFELVVKAGETWVFDCNAARIRSPLDPVLELKDAKGTLLKLAQSAWEQDPRLVYKFTTSGRYRVSVRDTQYQGGPDFAYRLTIGTLPVIEGWLPRGTNSGRRLGMDFSGVNLGKTRRAIVTIPAGISGVFYTAVPTEKGLSLPLPLFIDPAPVAGVTDSDANMPIDNLPLLLDGAFGKFSKIRFFFPGEKDKRVLFDLLGRRIGSRIDGAIRVYDMRGNLLAENDDAIGKDARLEFNPPATGMYTIEARNVEEKTGPECFYRLEARPVEPDFRLLLDVEHVAVGEGGTSVLKVTPERLFGFVSPIVIAQGEVAPGVVCSGGTIQPGEPFTEITLTAAPGATLGANPIRVVGKSTVAGREILRETIARAQYLPRSINPVLFTDDSYKRPFREYALLPVAVTPRAEPFRLEADKSVVRMAPGETREILVKATRSPANTTPIVIEARGMHKNVKVTAGTIASGQTEIKVTITTNIDEAVGARNLILVGKQGAVSQACPAIEVVIIK